MKKKFVCLFIPLLLLLPFHVLSQQTASGDTLLNKSKAQFLNILRNVPIDSVTVDAMTVYVDAEVNALDKAIAGETALNTLEKEKAVRSLSFFLQEMGKNLEKQSADLYDIQASFKSYRSILAAVVHHRSFNHLLAAFPMRRSQLLATAFSQYKEHGVLDDVAIYKRMAATPEYVLQFLESKPGFRYSDSLLIEAAAKDPMKFVFYLNRTKPGVQEKIRNSKNIYLEQIVALSQQKSASELLPFVKQIAEQKITTAEILQKRSDIVGYFQLLVNTLQESRHAKDPYCIFLTPLRNGIRQKSLAFFVNEINEQHNASDAIRFASVKNLRPVDLYYIITSCGDELYTSSYLGLYKRLMEHFKDQPVDSLFEALQYDNARTFMRLAANYNVLPDFLRSMPREGMEKLLKRFMAGIDTDTEAGLAIAMDIADSFTALASANDVNELAQAELKSNLQRSTSGQQYLGVRLYSILLQVFDLVKEEGALNKLWEKLGNYEILKRSALENKKGEIVQLVLFYGDEDGVASFKNFSQLYADGSKWRISKNENWVNIRSVSDSAISIYANFPLDIKQELDTKAQDSLLAFLHAQSLDPVVLVHRGHSYHLDKTLRRLSPSVRLAILGSCGGYNKAMSIATFNPDIQVIGSKKIGSKSINDPIIDVINETLIAQKDISWPEVWKQLDTRFSKDKVALGLFNEYFPPSNNISLFVLKLFMYSNRYSHDVVMNSWGLFNRMP